MNKDFIKDKTVTIAHNVVNSGKATVKVFGAATKTGVSTAAESIRLRSPSIYDESDDVVKHSSRIIISSGVRSALTANQAKVSLFNASYKARSKNLLKEARRLQERKDLIDKKIKNLSEREKALNATNNIVELDKLKTQKRELYETSYKLGNEIGLLHAKSRSNKKKINRSGNLSLKRSAKYTISQHTLRTINNIPQDDTGNNIVKKGISSVYYGWRYRRRFIGAIKSIPVMIKALIGGVVSFVSSTIGVITTLVANIPFLIILVAIISVMSFFNDLTYNGRISSFVDNETKLEKLYETNVAPDEILAITDVLGWTNAKYEDYEMLFGLLFDGNLYANADSNKDYTFEVMMDNVFRKYNPATNYNPTTVHSNKENTGFSYKYYSSILSIRKTDTLTYGELMNLYPNYQAMSTESKQEYGTDEYIDYLKEQCRSKLQANADNYIGSFFAYAGLEKEQIFTHYILEIGTFNRATYKIGYRTMGSGSSSFHTATDLGTGGMNSRLYAPCTAEVVYVSDGYTLSGDNGGTGYGNQIVFRIDMFDRNGNKIDLYVRYAHMENGSIQVKVGDIITGGQYVGNVGNTGYSFGYHLHLEGWVQKGISGYGSTTSIGKNVSLDDKVYCIYIDILCFYDDEYRNYVYQRN